MFNAVNSWNSQRYNTSIYLYEWYKTSIYQVQKSFCFFRKVGAKGCKVAKVEPTAQQRKRIIRVCDGSIKKADEKNHRTTLLWEFTFNLFMAWTFPVFLLYAPHHTSMQSKKTNLQSTIANYNETTTTFPKFQVWHRIKQTDLQAKHTAGWGNWVHAAGLTTGRVNRFNAAWLVGVVQIGWYVVWRVARVLVVFYNMKWCRFCSYVLFANVSL